MNGRATGPGAITRDGCAVDVYLRLPPGDDPAIVDGALRPGSTVLDLGTGTGRIATALAALGHRVTGVDDSAEMLAHAAGVETVHAGIEGLDLGRRFDAVLLASHLVNVPDDADRTALLATCRRHVADDGVVVIQRHAPGWFDTAAETEGRLGELTAGLTDVSRPAPGLLTATVYYADPNTGDRWTQTFTTRRLDDADLPAALAAADLEFGRLLTPDASWFTALPR